MGKKIKFSSSVAGTISFLDVTIAGTPVPSPQKKTTFEKTLDTGLLKVEYRIGGLNGTAFEITYSCSADGSDKIDPVLKSVVKGKITSGSAKTVTLNIPLS